MKIIRIYIAVGILLLFHSGLIAQIPDTLVNGNDEIENKIENIAQDNDNELDYTSIVEDIEELKNNPIDLNNTNIQELRKLLFLNELQITNLLKYVKDHGKMLSLYELQAIDGFNYELINKILPYIIIKFEVEKKKIKPRQVLKYGRNTIFLRYSRVLEEQEGFAPIDDSTYAAKPNSRYLGSPDKIYLRYHFKYRDNVSLGFTGEKDAGEEFCKGSQTKGFDFNSAHLVIKNIGIVKTLAMGDYSLQFGQGLNMWSSMSFGKSAEAINIMKSPQGIRQFTSTDENRFFRGAATTIGIKGIDISAFYSKKRIDGNITSTDTLNNEALVFSSLQETGYHSIPSELSDKDAIKETIMGGNIKYNFKGFMFGVTASNTVYGSELNKGTQLYTKFAFQGKENTIFSTDASYSFRNLVVFGEIARNDRGGIASVAGLIVNLVSEVRLSVLYRNYEKEYFSNYSSGFAEGSSAQNEKGLYTGISADLTPKLKFSAYVDKYNFPWLKYTIDAPSGGTDYLAQFDYNISRKTNFYIRYKWEQKNANNSPANTVMDYLVDEKKQSLRLHLNHAANSPWVMKSRFEISEFTSGSKKPSIGYLIYQDLVYQPFKKPYSFSARYALFDTDTYDSRIYAYESDVLYAFSIPAYYYKGSRVYFLLKYKLTQNIDFWLRYSQSYYNNRQIISSGLTEINGNTRSEIKAQIRIRF